MNESKIKSEVAKSNDHFKILSMLSQLDTTTKNEDIEHKRPTWDYDSSDLVRHNTQVIYIIVTLSIHADISTWIPVSMHAFIL